jgi:hypothetical protein
MKLTRMNRRWIMNFPLHVVLVLFTFMILIIIKRTRQLYDVYHVSKIILRATTRVAPTVYFAGLHLRLPPLRFQNTDPTRILLRNEDGKFYLGFGFYIQNRRFYGELRCNLEDGCF